MAATLPPGGETGEDRFRAAMAKTTAAMPAYEAYDEGRKALADEKPDRAIEQANNAIGMLPEEANFYALRGATAPSAGAIISFTTICSAD
jgi:hypothetical protein